MIVSAGRAQPRFVRACWCVCIPQRTAMLQPVTEFGSALRCRSLQHSGVPSCHAGGTRVAARTPHIDELRASVSEIQASLRTFCIIDRCLCVEEDLGRSYIMRMVPTHGNQWRDTTLLDASQHISVAEFRSEFVNWRYARSIPYRRHLAMPYARASIGSLVFAVDRSYTPRGAA